MCRSWVVKGSGVWGCSFTALVRDKSDTGGAIRIRSANR